MTPAARGTAADPSAAAGPSAAGGKLDAGGDDDRGTVLERLHGLSDFTPRERMVARALVANYPAAGLSTLATLAQSAGVSRPTVLRFVRTLGFTGYGEFQRALRAEIAPVPVPSGQRADHAGGARQRPHSAGPLSKLSARATGESSSLPGFARALTARLDDAFARIPVRDLEETIRLLTDTNARVLTAGGRFSSVLADYLSNNLSLVRPDAQCINDPFGHSAGRLIDLSGRDLVVVFDFPRYQRDVIELSRRALHLGARVIAVTDSPESPICHGATRSLIVPTTGPTPLDSYGAATILVEYLVARVFEQREEAALERMHRWNEVGRGHMVE